METLLSSRMKIEMDGSSVLLALSVGLGLSAACGFRIFLPPAALSFAAVQGWVELTGDFAYLDSWTACGILSAAVILEVLAYLIPWLDNLLDTIATPSAVIAGTVMSAAVMGDVDPALKWTLATIAGGGSSGTIQMGTVATRALSTGTTGGLANPIVSIVEFFASIFMTILALFAPILAVLLFAVIIFYAVKFLVKWQSKKSTPNATTQ